MCLGEQLANLILAEIACFSPDESMIQEMYSTNSKFDIVDKFWCPALHTAFSNLSVHPIQLFDHAK